jgi:small subunit ribosomal protein S20
MRAALRHFREALTKGDSKLAAQSYRETVSMLDKSVQKGVIHDNTASRYKSRLATRLAALQAKTA